MISSNSHLKYGKALYEVAASKQEEERVLHELKAACDLYHHVKVKKLLDALNVLEKSARDEVLNKTFEGKVNPLILNLLKMLAGSRKMVILPKVYEVYSHLYHEAKGIEEVTITSARALSKEEEHALVKKLEEKKKKKISAHFQIKPELIGGIQVLEKGYLYDGSIQNYLESLQKYLLHQETPFEQL